MKTAYLVAGLAYGDEGKGATVDYLVRKHQAGLVVRYNGGAQAAHNVITPEGKHHTFAQFGSGALAGARTHLSKHVLIEPRFMVREAEHLIELGMQEIWDSITIDEHALVITPFQIAANRIIEYYRNWQNNPHGTCGMGIGQTRGDYLKYGEDVLFAKDLRDEGATKATLKFLQKISRDAAYSWLCGGAPTPQYVHEAVMLLQSEHAIDNIWEEYEGFPRNCIVSEDYLLGALGNTDVVFEGAQGMLLDEKFGEPNHNTWTDITFTNANEILARADFGGNVERVGVLRSYFTRHGAGSFDVCEDMNAFPELHNDNTGFQGNFRRGYIDWFKVNYAINAIGGIDTLALNHLDYLERDLETTSKWVRTSKFILGYGPTATDRKEYTLGSKDDCHNNDDLRRSTCCS